MILFEFGDYKDTKEESSIYFKIDDLKSYLSNIWKNRKMFADYDDDEQNDENEKQGFLNFDGSKIKAKNYVGFIQYEGVKINIYPKIFKKNDTPSNDECNFYLNQIIYWLSYCSKINFPFSDINFEYKDCDNFLEAFIYIFSHYTEKIITENPYQCYQEITEESSFLRGRLDLPEYLNKNLATGNLQNFQCTYEPFIFDNLFNQIVKYTTKILLEVSNNHKNREKLESILFVLDEVTDKICFDDECEKVKFNKLFEELDIVLSMCKMFLANQTIKIDYNDSPNFCFLIPMEKVFEDFIYGFINKHFPEQKAKYQKSNKYLTDEKVFQMKPDIFLEKTDTIIDTKYKIRNLSNDDKKFGISQSDMYQMVCYGLKYSSKNIILLYPKANDCKDSFGKKQFTVSSSFFIGDTKINIFAYDITITLKEIKEIENKLKEELKAIFYNNNELKEEK